MGNQKTQGQITIYFALMILFIITCLAFVINVGLFVKAKINLQNAVDAAAFSGAAVQARQLSSIAYLNWEMRNNYKEWMFKYYVLGTLSVPGTDPALIQSSNQVNFRPVPGFVNQADSHTPAGDYYNIPTVCINPAGADSNICSMYFVPGIPRFNPLGLSGVDETIASFTNVIAEEKAKSCNQRGTLNFLTTLNWAFGVSHLSSTSPLLSKTPHIAWNRPGAWIQGLELAMRIRNLEKLINIRPQSNLCMSGDSCMPIQNLHQTGPFPTYERSVKAFWSAFRNLENNSGDLKSTFKLSELAPQAVAVQPTTLSGFLIPGSVTKYYVDLFLNTINLVSFYTLFVTHSSKYGTGGNAVQSEAACAGIKMGIPVPAFAFGFTKNTDVLTYYAVKGEAYYVGMFNPFQTADGKGIRMEAYAAAKPFGGKIGPQHFLIDRQTPIAVSARTRSYPYISGLEASPGSGAGQMTVESIMGRPVPGANATNSFWVLSAGEPFGGIPEQQVRFGIPNLLYGIYDLASQGGAATGSIQLIRENRLVKLKDPVLESGSSAAGLYNWKQFLSFRKHLGGGGQTVGAGNIATALVRVKAPTLYDGINYMIPNYDDSSPKAPSTPGMGKQTGEGIYSYTLFAPLWSDNAGMEDTNWTYYQPNQITTTINDLIRSVTPSIDTYVRELGRIAEAIRVASSKLDTSLGSDVKNYLAAADSLHDKIPSCKSTAGQYRGLFVAPACPGGTLLENAVYQLWQDNAKKNESYPTYFFSDVSVYGPPEPEDGVTVSNPNSSLMTTYQPGPVYGADEMGVFAHPFFGQDDDSFVTYTDRNYYSTKFIPIGTLMMSSYDSQIPYPTDFAVYSEKDYRMPSELGNVIFKNALDSSDTNVQNILQKGSGGKGQFPVRQ